MDFFASQELARRNTRRLVIYFIIAVISMIAAIYFLAMFVLGFLGAGEGGRSIQAADLFNPGMLAGVSLAVSSLVGSGSAYKIASLRGGGESVASMLGGRRVPPNSTDKMDRRILNVVEEMALAAGTPVPPVFVLDNEPGINAFAAGYTIDDAVIGVNRGTIETLSRDELQGVVAHEFSHILNGDMRMSIRMIGVLHGIQLIALIGYFVLRSIGSSRSQSSGNKKGGGIAVILAISLGLIVIGWAGLFFARLIKASVSRQREYLADASAVQFTRNPDGIAGALKMIGASMAGSQVQNPRAEETSHMFFASMFQKNFFQMFATHPPLPDRVKKLDPRFDGDFQEYAHARQQRALRREEARKKQEERQREKKSRVGIRSAIGGAMAGPSGAALGGMMGDSFPIDPLILIAGIGLPDEADVEYSELIVDRIPEELAIASREVFSARCVVFAALLNPETEIRRAQLHAVAEGEGQATIDETIRLMPLVDDLQARFRLPVFEILQGTLTGMSPGQYLTFRASVGRLVSADRKVDLFEFFLRQHLIVHLDRCYGKLAPPPVKYKAIDPLRDDIGQLLAIMVRVGHTDLNEARGAFKAAIDSIKKPWDDQMQRIDDDFNFGALSVSLVKLSTASPKIKKRVLTAMAIAITYDKIVTVEEAELFRAMSESLDCPVPPVVATIERNDAEV